ncbi:hypothetical protein [Saliphagus sp. LR7]|uniref:hypothetical protein n=1 Tax=Saliphagus sp. LR7 TaxID=2282654 RepID=UPI0013002048|nr:hypothetical protein [Saliphagus sp. LR7]
MASTITYPNGFVVLAGPGINAGYATQSPIKIPRDVYRGRPGHLSHPTTKLTIAIPTPVNKAIGGYHERGIGIVLAL